VKQIYLRFWIKYLPVPEEPDPEFGVTGEDAAVGMKNPIWKIWKN
jgi:hypothetical protein